MLKNKFHFSKLFNKRNLVKIIVIFIVGFISRILVNHFFDINVFTDCFHFISFAYYFIMAIFIVFFNYFIESFDFSILFDFLPFDSIKPSFKQGISL